MQHDPSCNSAMLHCSIMLWAWPWHAHRLLVCMAHSYAYDGYRAVLDHGVAMAASSSAMIARNLRADVDGAVHVAMAATAYNAYAQFSGVPRVAIDDEFRRPSRRPIAIRQAYSRSPRFLSIVHDVLTRQSSRLPRGRCATASRS